ncbi:hypothetical protein OG393_07185 [Streptomyces sp. NBC_01216]|uniref:four-carbon acid sugar kinase family protein n=1 Tax=Streptomyces sp. NBC_01216 TaxID=2903778 RepID=UPI002E14B574|nr:hypothetical protein OG393_07185 [Streptomyces sp. NBC_01216]
MRDDPTDAVTDIVVLADDLTSAGDGAAPFRRAGHRAGVLLRGPGDDTASAPRLGGGVIAADLGSRLLGEARAAARTERAARAYREAELLIKTVDSTLRGHVAAEIRAARAGSGRHTVVIAPAFPAEGRITVGGVQYVRGVPVHESEFARDPAHPVVTSDLARLLPEAEVLAPEQGARWAEPLSGGGIFVYPAATDDDLDRLVHAVDRPREVLWVGSPGLAAALARRHPRPPHASTPSPVLPAVRRPLVVVGSAHPATRRQLDRLRTRGDVAAAEVAPARGPGAAVDALRRADAPVLVVHTPDARRDAGDAQALTRDLASVAAGLTAEGLGDGLLVTGGETAVTVLEALGATGIELFDEPEPGIARGVLLGPRPVPTLIKAGGFGDDVTLERLTGLLRDGADRPATATAGA